MDKAVCALLLQDKDNVVNIALHWGCSSGPNILVLAIFLDGVSSTRWVFVLVLAYSLKQIVIEVSALLVRVSDFHLTISVERIK